MARSGSGGAGRHGGWPPRLAVASLLLAAPAAGAAAPSVAFFYARPVPVAALGRFDWVVVEADNVASSELAALRRAGAQVFAYLSLGEAAPASADPAWILGGNAAWGSAIVDPGAEGWRRRVLDRAGALRQNGYDGLFLDTLDSYRQVLHGPRAQREGTVAMAALVRAIHARHPDLRLLLNRGFEILDEVGSLAAGVAAESLFCGWDPAAKRYVDVPESDREWLAGRLREVAERLRIPVIVVDYLPPSRRDEARDVARRIEAMGFVPWISTPGLDVVGVGAARATRDPRAPLRGDEPLASGEE